MLKRAPLPSDDRNWCVVNQLPKPDPNREGENQGAVVLGVGGKLEDLVYEDKVRFFLCSEKCTGAAAYGIM